MKSSKCETLTPERENEIRRDVELGCASQTEAMLIAALDEARARSEKMTPEETGTLLAQLAKAEARALIAETRAEKAEEKAEYARKVLRQLAEAFEQNGCLRWGPIARKIRNVLDE